MTMLLSIHIVSDTIWVIVMEWLVGQGFFDIQNMTDFLDTVHGARLGYELPDCLISKEA